LQTTIPEVDGIRVLGWPDEVCAEISPGVAAAVIDAARLSASVTVVDLGRICSPAQREALGRCDRVLMLVPADVRSVRAARRLLHRQELPMCEVIVRGPNPGGLTAHDVQEAIGLPVIAALAADRNLDRRLERGEPPGYRSRTPLARAGDGILQEVLR
jgi:Flp pilus assembly CpaE family ATPase